MLKKIIYAFALIAGMAMLPSGATQFGAQRPEPSQQERDMEQRRQKEANKKRQDEIRDETHKLYQLAGELKDAVDKSNEHVLSLDVVKKAEEVEKLAKKVKEKMRDGVGRPIETGPPATVPRPPFGLSS